MDKLALTIGGTPIPAPPGVPTGGFLTLGNILSAFLSLVFIIAIVLALIFLILGGIRWILSSGDPKGVEAARKQITYAIIGLVIVVTSFVIVRLVVTLLGGNPNFFLNIPNTP